MSAQPLAHAARLGTHLIRFLFKNLSLFSIALRRDHCPYLF
jgi:hypothetical protein